MAKRKTATASSSEELRNIAGPASYETAAPQYVAAKRLTFTREPGRICRPRLQSIDWRKQRFYTTQPNLRPMKEDEEDD